MSVVDDMVTIETYIKTLFPAAITGKQKIPLKPPPNSFYVVVDDENRVTETRYHFRNDRVYQIVHFAERPDTALANMSAFGDAVLQTELIKYIRVNDWSTTQPFETEDADLYAIIGVLDTSVRQARIQKAYPKINNVNVTQI
ncbi:hypothetical protein NYE48_27765 [Paenibacillus sp. FSL M7-1455]|uniref:hypothetical protein n=1 Tax=Paenibacillus sp. FSL M7-1455 TaxID=2975316 RepID=UPI0030F56A14